MLELVKSPFVFPTDNVTLTSLLPSFYIMLMNKDELKKYNSKNIDLLCENAICYFDNDKFVNDDLKIISQKILEGLGILNKVSPEDTTGKPAPLSETDGSQM